MSYDGIDYGMGTTNIDRETGIRYGVISLRYVLQAWADSSEPDYGDPHCPKCGNDAEDLTADDVYFCRECEYLFDSSEAYPDECECPHCPKCGNNAGDLTADDAPDLNDMTVEEWECDGTDYFCRECEYLFGANEAYPDECECFRYDDTDYHCWQDSYGDIFVMRSPYYTRGRFCSPCAPGAVSLGTDGGIKAYCFGEEWFDDDFPCNYPIFDVATDHLVYWPDGYFDGILFPE